MLSVRLCGGVAVEVDGRRVPDSLLAGRQGRLVLAYLLCERHRSVPREELAELLWPQRLPASWTTSLSVVVSKLRRLLSEAGLDPVAVLVSAFGTYQLDLPKGTWIDWDVVAETVERAEEAVHTGDFRAAAPAAKEGIDIAQRGFLTDDCPWVDAQRERLRDLHIRAMQTLAEAHLLAGEKGRAASTARDALALDELREASYRLLMQALAACGERAEALRVWERCRVMLAEELGVDPAPETEAIYLSLLGGSAAPAPPQASSSSLPSGVVTFLLTDIVDSSAIWDRNPAAMSVALERHDHLVADIVATHSGVVLKAKLEGDATVSVFPRASAAAMAALDFRAALANELWPDGAELEVRMALHTGEAIERDGDYYGPALNRAARLRGLAGPGQILVSQTVADVIRDHLPDEVSLASLGRHQLRGLTREEHVFQLAARALNEPDEPSPLQQPPMPTVLAAGGPFVGRAAELDRLSAEWATSTTGTARAALLAGEPGVGKSRLAAEWAKQAHGQGALVLYGRCDEELGAPYQPFAEALRALLPAVGSPRLRSVRGVEHIARLVPDLTDLVAVGRGAPQGDADSERSLLFDALTRLLAAVSAETPILLVIDDLHWAATPTLLLLRHLLRGGDGIRLLVVGTYRSTDLRRSHPLAGILADLHRDGTTDRINLTGLPAEDVSAYLRAAGHDDRRLGDALSTVTSGNPFFLIEVLRHVEETGGNWDPTTLPQGVREAVDRRLSRLSDLANEALLVGAVAGSQFSLDLIEQVLEGDLVEPIDEARRAGLVVEDSGGRFRFCHTLVRQSLLADVATVKRVRLHQRIAAVLEGDPTYGEGHLADLARHWFECAFAGGAAKAVDYSRRAGDLAMARLAYEEAADLYAQALQAAEVEGSGCGNDQKAELLLAHCEALLAAGDPAAAAGVVEQLGRVSRHSPRLSGWATCLAGQLAVLIHPERLETTVAEVTAAADAFARRGDAEGEANAHTVAASCLARLGRVADSEAALDRALVAARLAGNPRRVNAVLAFAPLAALSGPSPVPQASGRCLDVVRVLRITTGSPAVEAAALRCQAVLEAVRGRSDAARRMLDSARRSLESLGHAHGLLETDLYSGMVELSGGRSADAELLLRRAYEGFVARGVGADAAQAAALLARALLPQGRLDEAIELTKEAERLAGDDMKAAMAWRAARAEALARQGQIAEATELARRAVVLVDPTDALLDRAEAHLTLAMVLRAAGDRNGAELEGSQAVELYERKGATALAESTRRMVRVPPASGAPPAVAGAGRRRARTNTAASVVFENLRLIEAGDIDGWAACFSEDFVEVDHISHLTTDLARFVDLGRTHVVASRAHDAELLATLGDRHSLTRHTVRYERSAIVEPTNQTGPLEFVQLYVEESNGDQRYCRLERFRGDDMHLALARLIELHADDELPPDRRAGRYTLADNIREGRGGNSPDIEIIDRRPGRLWTLQGRDALRGAAGELRQLSADLVWRTTGILGLTENVALFEVEATGHNDEGGPVQFSITEVLTYGEDGLIASCEVFLPEQVDDALRRFDELSDAVPDVKFENRVTVLVQRLTDGILAADPDAGAPFMVEDVVLDDRRAIVAHRSEGRSAYLAYMRSVVESGVTHLSHGPFAIRGRCLVLERTTAGGPQTLVESLAVQEATEDGRLLSTVVFNPDEVDAAYEELDARYLAGEGAKEADTLRPVFGYVAAYNSHDPAGCVRWLADGFTAVDRDRRIGAEELVAELRSTFERVPDARARILDVEAVDEGDALLLWQDTETVYLVARTADDRIAGFERFGLDRRAEALRQLRKLVEPEAAVAEPRRRARPNAAFWWGELDTRLFNAGDVESWEQSFADDFVDIDHVSHVSTDRETFVRSARAYVTEPVSIVRDLVASLGERHSLIRYAFNYDEVSLSERANRTGAVQLDRLGIESIDTAGRAKRLERFRPEDLHLGLARLIELHADEELPAERREGRYVLARQIRELRARWSPDVRQVDHRPAGLWTFEGRQAMVGALGGLSDLSSDLRWRIADVFGLTERVALIEIVADGHNDVGGAVQFQVIVLEEFGDDGLIHTIELYLPEQLHDALARFDELVGAVLPTAEGERRRRVRPNISTASDQFSVALLPTGDIDAWIQFFSPDLVDVDHTSHMSTGRDDLLRMVQIYAATDSHEMETELLASLGERHHLSRTTTRMEGAAMADTTIRTGATEVVLFIVNRAGPGGRPTRFERFGANDFHLALARLVEMHADDELPPERRRERYRVAEHLRQGANGRLSMWKDDAVLVDHRPASLGVLQGREKLLNTQLVLHDLAGDLRWHVVDVLGFDERLTALELMADGVTADGGSFQISVVLVSQYDEDGSVVRADCYRTDQVAEALERFDQLSANVGEVEIPPSNSASIALKRSDDAFAVQQLDECLACYSTDVVHEDRRPLVRTAGRGRRAIEDDFRQATGILQQSGVSMLATRGDRLSLHRVSYRGGDEDWGVTESDLIRLIETDDDGLICTSIIFGPDDIDAAFAELDARFDAGEAGPFGWAAQTAAYNRGDRVAFEAKHAPDVVYVEHRPAAFGDLDREQLLNMALGLFDLVPDAHMRVLAVPRVTALGFVAIYEITGHDLSGGDVTWRDVAVLLYDKGLVQRYESFSIHDLPEAVARFEELNAERP